jgi:hypothetical protein
MSIGKRIFSLCLAAWTLTTALPFSAMATDTEDEDSGIVIDTSGDEVYDIYTYKVVEDTITITSCDTAATVAEIPTEIDGIPVTAIGDAAFMSCGFLTNLTVPEGITSIGESAFSECSMLCTVTLPESLTTLGKGAFESCTMLSIVELPDSLTELPDALFYDCSYLPELTLPAHLEKIGKETFYSCTILETITLPETLTEIGNYAFQNCQALTSVTLPAACENLGDYVFDGCQALLEIDVAPENPAYTSIDGVLFTGDGETLLRFPQNSPVTSYTVPESCTALADWSFIGSTLLEQIDLGQVTEIGEDCFYYCTSLQSIEVPEGVTTLPGAVFGYCLAMETATLPSTLEEIGDHCFYSCASLAEINIPDGVTSLGDGSFYNCVALLELRLPASITEIGEQALGYYTPSTATDSSKAERIALLQVHNDGSAAVSSYLFRWKLKAYLGWIIAGAILLVIAAFVLLLVWIHRKNNRIRPTSRTASSANASKKRPKSERKRS